MKYNKSIFKNEYSKYTFWFLLCTMIILLPFCLLDRSLIQAGDAFNQSFPVFVYIGQWLRAALCGEIRLFDFRLGLGDDVIYALNWHGFGDITQIVSAIVPYEYAEYAYNFVMIIKLWLCGNSFLIYINRYVKNEEYRIIGALLYVFNNYALVWGFNCWIFLTPMMTFPLILNGIDDILEKKKSLSKSLLIGIWIQALNGFYFLYMEVMLTILYFGIKEFIILKELILGKWKKLFRDGIRIFVSGLLGMGLGGPLLLPSIIGYLQSNRNGGGENSREIIDFILYPTDYYRKILSHLLIPNIYRNIFTLSFIGVFGILIAFSYKEKRNREHKLFFLLLIVLYGIPLWGRLMNGFSSNTDRWVFGLFFVAIVLAVTGLDAEGRLSKRTTAVFYLWCVGLIVLFFLDDDWYMGKILPIVLYSGIGISLPLLYNLRQKYFKLVIPFGIFLIVMNGLLVFSAREMGGSGHTWGFKRNGVTKREIDQNIDILEDSEEIFERKDVYATSLGASLVKNFYGTAEYFSMLNGNTSEFYKSLYISPGLFGATWILKGLDGRTELEALCSVSQIMEYTGDNHDVLYKDNEMYLPLGITYESWISRDIFENLNPMEKQAALMKYVVLENEEDNVARVSVPYSNEVEQNILKADEEVKCTFSMQNIIRDEGKFYAEENANIHVVVNVSQNQTLATGKELYIQLQDMKLLDEGTADIWVGNKKIQLRNANDSYYMGIDEFWINVTELNCDEDGYYFNISLPEGKWYSLKQITAYEHEIDSGAILERKENTLEDLKIETNKISGVVKLEKPMLILFTIPYSTGWKVYINGVEQPAYKADIGFLAIELNQGKSTIVLQYRTPGLVYGCVWGGASAGILLIILVLVKMRRSREVNDKKYSSMCKRN